MAGLKSFHKEPTRGVLMLSIPFLILAGSALFTIRGYTIQRDAVLVHRLFWSTRLPRAGLLEVAPVDRSTLRWSLRTFGNGGLFSFSGLYWNRQLGKFRPYVTDWGRTVVLRYPHRTVLLSPERPQQFITQLLPGPAA